MKFLKISITYIFWLLFSILSAMLSVFVEIGGFSKKNTGFLAIFNGLEEFIVFYFGIAFGILAFLFFLAINYYQISPKNWSITKKNSIRLLTIMTLTILITIIHYILEYVVDWI